MFYNIPIEKFEIASKDIVKRGYFTVNNFLPKNEVDMLLNALPSKGKFKVHKNQFESKRVFQHANAFNQDLTNIYDDLLNEDSAFVKVIKKVCNLEDIFTDFTNYAGGISVMGDKDYLDMHIDNSHNSSRKYYRRINILYYLSKKEWREGDGGELVLRPFGNKGNTYKIPPINNTLVVMLTNRCSEHGVEMINSKFERFCISTYYYSTKSQSGKSYYHCTTFKYPDNKLKNLKSLVNAKFRSFYQYLK